MFRKGLEIDVGSILFFLPNLLYKELFDCTDYKKLEEVAKDTSFPSREV